MKKRFLAALLLPLFLLGFASCRKKPTITENIDPAEKAAAARLQPFHDPIEDGIDAFRMETRQAYNTRRFDDLEKGATALRATKAVFGNGSWKIAQFYDSLECRDEEPESMWELHDRIHQDWIAAKPASITARVAYADFFTSYAWHARGAKYASGVTNEGWKLFEKRLAAAQKIMEDARLLTERDPYEYKVRLTIALGQNWSGYAYERLLTEAHQAEPKFWGYDTARAYSLLPRWHGRPGDWEAYADEAAARPDGLGLETYARIVIYLAGFYDNVFQETKISWPKTRDGLALMREKYPDSILILNYSALLATTAMDRPAAKDLFEHLDDRYMSAVWSNPGRFTHYKHWAETGEW